MTQKYGKMESKMKRWWSSKNKYFLCLALFLLALISSLAITLSPITVKADTQIPQEELQNATAKVCAKLDKTQPGSVTASACIKNGWCKTNGAALDCKAGIDQAHKDDVNNNFENTETNTWTIPYINRLCAGLDNKLPGADGQTAYKNCSNNIVSKWKMCAAFNDSASRADCMKNWLSSSCTDYGKSDEECSKIFDEAGNEASGNQTSIDQCKTDVTQCATESDCKNAGGNWSDNKCVKPNSDNADNSDNANDENDPCRSAVDGFGWIMCPGASVLSQGIDLIMKWIDNQMTFTVLADKGDTMKGIWQSFLNIANIAFVIVFLIMIYSMATSTGISNYTIKKILPRLIICAVAVNLSFYICAAAVDLSNITGKGIYALLRGQSTNEVGDAGDLFQGIFNNVFQTVSLAFVAIFALSTMLPPVIVACLAILAAIIFRQVALVVMVVISPVAIVCYLLPNTQKWATKWQDLFIKLLLVYPMFMAVWGGSRLVSNIMKITDANDEASIISMVAIPSFCAVAPAFAIMPLFRASGGLMQMATNGIQKFADKSKLKDRIASSAPNRFVGRLNSAAARKYRQGFNVKGHHVNLPGRNSGTILNAAAHGDDLTNKFDKKVADATDSFVEKNLTNQQKKDIITTGSYSDKKNRPVKADSYLYASAMKAVGEDMSFEDADKALAVSNSMASNMNEQDARRVRSATVAGLKKAKAGLGGQLLRDYEAGKFNGVSNDYMQQQILQQRLRSAGGYSANKLAEMPSYQLSYLYSQITSGMSSSDPAIAAAATQSAQRLGGAAQAALKNDNINIKLDQAGTEQVKKFAAFAQSGGGYVQPTLFDAAAAGAGTGNAGNYGQDRFGGAGSQAGPANSGATQSNPTTSRTVDQSKVKQWASEGAVDLNNPEAVKQAQSGRRGAGNNSPVDGTTPYGDKPYYDAKGQVAGGIDPSSSTGGSQPTSESGPQSGSNPSNTGNSSRPSPSSGVNPSEVIEQNQTAKPGSAKSYRPQDGTTGYQPGPAGNGGGNYTQPTLFEDAAAGNQASEPAAVQQAQQSASGQQVSETVDRAQQHISQQNQSDGRSTPQQSHSSQSSNQQPTTQYNTRQRDMGTGKPFPQGQRSSFGQGVIDRMMDQSYQRPAAGTSPIRQSPQPVKRGNNGSGTPPKPTETWTGR